MVTRREADGPRAECAVLRAGKAKIEDICGGRAGGYARVPLRSPRGNLAGIWRRSLERVVGLRGCGGWLSYGNRSHGQPPRTVWVAAMITPAMVAVVLGGVAVLAGGRGTSGPVTVDVAPSA
jgi:hypothetical protein